MESEMMDFYMILIGGYLRIAHTGILQELEMSNFDKTRPACQWDDDSG